MPPVSAADPSSKVAYTFNDPTQLQTAIEKHGFIALHSDGTPYKMYSFEGGILLDGAPLNTYFNGFWYEGQQDILANFWKSGQVSMPAPDILALPVVPAPPEVVAFYAAQKGVPNAPDLLTAFRQGGSFGGSTWVWIAGAAVLAWWFLR